MTKQNRIWMAGKYVPKIICKCTKEQYNKIATKERTRGRAQITVKPNKFTLVEFIGYTPVDEYHNDWWVEGKCPDCGSISIMRVKAFNNATACRSCASRASATIYDIKYNSIKQRWDRMWARCTKPSNPKYSRYGGRGITVCREWVNYHAFQEWCLSVVDKYPEDGRDSYLEIHRLDNDEGYTPSNCVLLSTSEHSTLTNEHKRSSNG